MSDSLPSQPRRRTRALQFQREWLSRYAVDRVLNLADLRYQLFTDAIRPALIVRYRKAPPDELQSVGYWAPKTDWASLHAGQLRIAPQDRTQIDLREVLSSLRRDKMPSAWKEHLWGTPRDWRFLDRLFSFPRLGSITAQPHKGETKRWLIAQGFKPENDRRELANEDGDGSHQKPPIPRPWRPEHLFLDAKSKKIDLLLNAGDCTPLGNRFPLLHRNPGAQEIFKEPHVLVTQGMRVAYCDFDVVFRHAIQGIHGPRGDADLLMLLAAVLSSPLGRYFLFHTAANWGTERPKVHEEELLRLPFPLPDETGDPQAAWEIVREVVDHMKRARQDAGRSSASHSQNLKRLSSQIDPLIEKYYDLDEFESMLVRDTIEVWMPSATPRRQGPVAAKAHRLNLQVGVPALDPARGEEREAYLEVLVGLLNEWASGGPYRFTATSMASKVGVGVVALHRDAYGDSSGRGSKERVPEDDLDSRLRKLRDLVGDQRGSLLFSRDCKIFDGASLYLIKSLSRRSWTKTTALNDADEIASALLQVRRGVSE